MNFPSIFRNIVFFSTIAFFLFLPLNLFFHMEEMSQTHIMSTNECSYTSSESAICPMNFFVDLIQLTQSLFTTVPSFKFIILSILCFIAINLLIVSISIEKIVLYIKRQRYRNIQNLYQLLFACGILNPKIH